MQISAAKYFPDNKTLGSDPDDHYILCEILDTTKSPHPATTTVWTPYRL